MTIGRCAPRATRPNNNTKILGRTMSACRLDLRRRQSLGGWVGRWDIESVS